MRNAFLLYIDRLEVLDGMSDADAGKLFRAIRDYVKDGSTPERGTIVSIAFLALKPALDSDSEKYHLMCLKRSEAGKRGGRPRKQENSETSDEKQEKAEKANAFEEEANESKKSKCFFEKAKKADTNTKTNTNTDTDVHRRELNSLPSTNAQARERGSVRSAFRVPSVDEVQDYCNERGNGINAEEFIAHYESNGWMVGKARMKDWRAAVRTWELRRRGEPKRYTDKQQTSMDAIDRLMARYSEEESNAASDE